MGWSPSHWRLLAAACALAAAALAPGARGEPFDPYRVPPERLHATVTTIALRPASLPWGVADPGAVRGVLEPIIEAKLAEKGYEVIPSHRFGEIWRAMSERVGGVWDPVSGQRLAERYETVWRHTVLQLSRSAGANAVLFPYLRFDHMDTWPVPNELNEAMPLHSDGGVPLFWKGQPIVSAYRPTKVRGLFLNLEIRDLSDVVLYGIRAPLKWSEVIVEQSRERVPDEELYFDVAAYRRVVDLDLEALGPAER